MKKKSKLGALLGAVGVLSNTAALQSCSMSEPIDENEQVSNSTQKNTIGSSVYKIGIPITTDDKRHIEFLSDLSSAIIQDPHVANTFAKGPNEYAKKMGYYHEINLDNGLIKLILALGDKEIVDSIKNNNVNAFVQACKKNGLINFESLNKDPYLNELSLALSEYKNLDTPLAKKMGITPSTIIMNQDEINNLSAVYGAVAIVIAAIAVEAVVIIGTTTWVTHVHGGDNGSDGNGKLYNKAIEIWDLKSDSKNTYLMTNEVNNALVNEGLNVIKDNFPDIYKKVDKRMLRNIILLNLENNI